MILFKNITKFYPPDIYAAKDVNLEIEAGEFVSIVGRSGAGKTTLVKLLLAEERATSGRVIVGGWDITRIKASEIPLLRRQIGVVFQDFKLLPKKTVFENVAFALEVCNISSKEIKKIVPRLLEIVGLEKMMDRFPQELSGGEAQKVSLARALAHRPKILVADEPTGNLDFINGREIISLLEKINQLGTTILLVTHNREIVNLLKKRVIQMDRGKIISDKQRARYTL
jgi:cell division transport system ATP-binding protein